MIHFECGIVIYTMSKNSLFINKDPIMYQQTEEHDHECRVSIIAGEVIIKKYHNENNKLSRHTKVFQSPTRIPKYSINKALNDPSS